MDELHHDNERHLVENYMKLYCLEELLDETVNSILEHRPDNPYVELARLIENKSMAEILDVQLTGTLGEQGRSAVTATIITNIGSFNGSFGLVTKQYLEDEELIKDFSMSTGKVNAILKGLDPRNMREIDEKLSSSQNINPSVIIALSIACCRAAARHRGTTLYQFLAEQADNSELAIPVPICTPVARSAAGRTNVDGMPLLQDITLTPTNVSSFEAAMEALNTATNLINRALVEKNVRTSIYRERGATNLVFDTLEETLSVVTPVLEAMNGTSQIKIGVDTRINNFLYQMPVKEDAKPGSGDVYYLLKAVVVDAPLSPRSAAAAAPKGAKVDLAALAAAAAAAPIPVPEGAMTGQDMVGLYVDLWKAHGLLTLEEPFHVGDMAGIKAFKQKFLNIVSTGDCPPTLSYAVHEGIGHDVNCHLQLVADSTVKTPDDIARVEAEGVFDTLKVNLFKAGSVYKALQLVKAAKAAKWAVIVGVEETCNETNDDFIADFAVAVGAGQFSGGGFGSGECMCKYNRILDILREHDTIPFAGRNFRG